MRIIPEPPRRKTPAIRPTTKYGVKSSVEGILWVAVEVVVLVVVDVVVEVTVLVVVVVFPPHPMHGTATKMGVSAIP